MNQSKYIFYQALVATLFFALIMSQLVQKGMFLDGTVYACISSNLTNNTGSFWHLEYTPAMYPEFYEHPPLHFYFCSVLFRLLGDHLYVEKIYSLLCFLLTALLIRSLFRAFSKQDEVGFSWLPVLLWLISPLVAWSFTNNMIENTLSIFCIAAVISLVKYCRSRSLLWLLTSCILIVLGFFTKGFVILFALIVPLFFALVFNSVKWWKGLLQCIYVSIICLILVLLLFKLNDDAYQFMEQYFETQVVRSLTGARETSGYFSIPGTLVQSLIPAAVICVAVYFIERKKVDRQSNYHLSALFFLLIAISASLPLMISPKQNGYYIVPSLAFYGLSAAFFALPYFEGLHKWIFSGKGRIYFQTTILILLAASIIVCLFLFGKVSRDADLMADIKKINAVTGGRAIATPSVMMFDYNAIANFKRLANINLYFTNRPTDLYFITTNPTNTDTAYSKVENLNTTKYFLYKKKQPPLNQ